MYAKDIEEINTYNTIIVKGDSNITPQRWGIRVYSDDMDLSKAQLTELMEVLNRFNTDELSKRLKEDTKMNEEEKLTKQMVDIEKIDNEMGGAKLFGTIPLEQLTKVFTAHTNLTPAIFKVWYEGFRRGLMAGRVHHG